MRGIIYKDVCLFFKGLNKWTLPIIFGALAILVVKTGIYTGMLFSIMMAMMVGAQNILVFEKEEKADWKKYQRTLPVSCGKTVAGKYAAVLVTTLVSLTISVVVNLAAFAVCRSFLLPVLGLSALMSALIPVVWAAVNLPFYYWFGFQVSQFSNTLLIFPMFFMMKNYEDCRWTAADLAAISANPRMLLLFLLLAAAAAFLISMAVSTAGYRFRRQ